MFKLLSDIKAGALCMAIVAMSAPNTWADDFDLDSQRGEKQEVSKVPGHKIDHNGLVINPTPQSIVCTDVDAFIDAKGGFTVIDKSGSVAASDYSFLPLTAKGGIPVVFDLSERSAKKAGVNKADGAYVLNITPKGVNVTSRSQQGAFYAMQTLRQILSSEISNNGTRLPLLTINDYPSMKYRGIVEGFYGTPWSHRVRLSLLDFYGANKLNDYLYGPKDDPYHSSPYWRQPYPEKEAQQIRELAERAKKNHVNFVWAIHPGKDIRWTKEDYDSLVNKLDMMYDLGVRSFAVFFDDIEGIGMNPVKQAELLNDLTSDFVKRKGDVTNLIVCPTDYSQLWAKPGPDGPLAVYGRELNPDVEVFWTGAVVCSDLTPETMEFVDSRIKRPALYWWNYPVTDYCKHILLQGPVYGLDTTVDASQVVGIESNPMEHGEASKLALYSVADYAWNTSAYNPIDSWERGLEHLAPGVADAYRTFAIHSADTETGYRRDESWETSTFDFNRYTPEQFEALTDEFNRILNAEATLRKGMANKALLAEMSPWLAEFTKLGRRGLNTLDLIKTFEEGNPAKFWSQYTANIMDATDRNLYDSHKIGTMKLQPFYERAMNGMVSDYFQRLSGKVPAIYSAIGTYPNLATTQSRTMLDSDTTTYYHSGASQGNGHWIGLDLKEVRPVYNVDIYQGRRYNDFDDYFDVAFIETSIDGKNWTAITDTIKGVHHIYWESDQPVQARYVRLSRGDSKKPNWTAMRVFEVNRPSQKSIGLNVKANNLEEALYAFDSTPLTHCALLDENVSFDRVPGAETITVLCCGTELPLRVTQYDEKGNVIDTVTTTDPYFSTSILPATVRINIFGKTNLYEVIQR